MRLLELNTPKHLAEVSVTGTRSQTRGAKDDTSVVPRAELSRANKAADGSCYRR